MMYIISDLLYIKFLLDPPVSCSVVDIQKVRKFSSSYTCRVVKKGELFMEDLCE